MRVAAGSVGEHSFDSNRAEGRGREDTCREDCFDGYCIEVNGCKVNGCKVTAEMATMEHVMICAAKARPRASAIAGASHDLPDHRIERRFDDSFGASLKLGTCPIRLGTRPMQAGTRPIKTASIKTVSKQMASKKMASKKTASNKTPLYCPARPPRKLLRVKGLGSRLSYPQATFVPPSIFARQPSHQS